MVLNLPKEIADSMRTCILSLFWRKVDVIDFFHRVGCTKEDLRRARNYEALNLTRTAIVEDIMTRIQARSDGGVAPMRNAIRELINWSTFDPYLFGPGGKLDIAKAKASINHLRAIQTSYDDRIKDDIIKQREREKAVSEKHSLDEIRKRFILLHKGQDENGKVINSQKRGYLLEAILKDLCQFEKLNVTDHFQFNLVGEQIDGSLKFDGENYIVEAKWQDDLVASNALYQFAGKIEGKMYGRGIFISINGFSADSVRALKQGKALKSVLVDGADMSLIMEGILSFTEVIDKKIKAAQTMGYIYIDPHSMKEKVS